MDEKTVERLAYTNGLIAEMHSKVARLEGMKTANNLREIQELSPAYSEDAFLVVQQELETISEELKNSI